MIKEYKVCSKNSTVLGHPGREFDWSKFCWDGSDILCDDAKSSFRGYKKGTGAYEIEHNGFHAPLPHVDNGWIAENCEYLHVPYDWSEMATIYRVRPNESMYTGKIWHNHRVIKQTAVKKDDGWYWRLELKDEKEIK